MNLEEIKLLIDILKETDVTELEVKNGDSKIRIKRGCHGVDYPPFETAQSRLRNQKQVKPQRKKRNTKK